MIKPAGLIDALEDPLHRIFYRGEVHVVLGKTRQGRVKGRGLAAAGGSYDQDDHIWFRYGSLAECYGQSGDPDLCLLVLVIALDAPVLGAAFFSAMSSREIALIRLITAL